MKKQFLYQVYAGEDDIKRLKPLSGNEINQDIQNYQIGDKLIITLEKQHRRRSVKQNNLLHLYFQIISDETGHSTDEIKELMKYKFLRVPMTNKAGDYVVNTDGEIEMVIRQTSKLTTVEAIHFADQIRHWAATLLKCELPVPEEQQELQFKK